jgi:hypothetical protein
MILAFDLWTLCPTNAVFDIGPYLEDKLALVRTYQTQLATVDYERYARSLAYVRGFHHGAGSRRNEPVEGYLALPNRDYCDLVLALYGSPGKLTTAARRFFDEPLPGAADA